MSASLNKVILIGNLGKEPEIRTLETGAVMCRFPIATTEVFKNRENGEKNKHTEWHNIVLWGGLAEVAENYLHKGDKVLIEGRIRSRSWKEKESNQIRYITEIRGSQMQMLGSINSSLEAENNKKQKPMEGVEPDENIPF